MESYSDFIKKWTSLSYNGWNESISERKPEMLKELEETISDYKNYAEQGFCFVALIVTNEDGNVFQAPVKVFRHEECYAYKTVRNGVATVYVDVIAVKQQAKIQDIEGNEHYQAVMKDGSVKPIAVRYFSGNAEHFPFQVIFEDKEKSHE